MEAKPLFLGSPQLPREAGTMSPRLKDWEAEAKEARCLVQGQVGTEEAAGIRSRVFGFMLFSFLSKLPFG